METAGIQEFDNFKDKINSYDAYDKAMSELNKLKMMAPMSAEATVMHMHLEWMTDIRGEKQLDYEKTLLKRKNTELNIMAGK